MEPIKVMLDSNILISSIYTRNGVASQVFEKAAKPPYSIVLCSQILAEVYRFFYCKFPSKVHDIQSAIASANFDLVQLINNDPVLDDESKIRDINDRPILRTARKANVQLFITGDKDFLESLITYPKILTIAQFLNL
ncbi:MAG: putative toxin-antitoxin system toxin component, PIN family [Deltaproteobacteria bacterium]|jgi:putative PIN family toxin of toxin-antitoxin system|nr:putative toxin-antitoxin system toxin component, PIN family [Deltaproteobacteria bacterium]